MGHSVMVRKYAVLFCSAILLSVAITANVKFEVVFGWSNGGYSDDPSKPDYGTHYWIAEHALDYLPWEEKQFILDNLAVYLYGTELPDNSQAPDGIGDTGKHHIYCFANGSLQEDDAAVRAREEYEAAGAFAKVDDMVNAAKKLGVMSHYIVDVAVFAHVMGDKTDWGSENKTVHSSYESYVNARTNSYIDEFNMYLAFDGELSETSAYNATLKLAYDTTFDEDGDLTCVWMNQNYDWQNQTFRNRCGESLNLAVNLLADVLHTFYIREVIPEYSQDITVLVMTILMVTTAIIYVYKKHYFKRHMI